MSAKAGLVTGLVVAVLVSAGAVVVVERGWPPWDPRMSEQDVERALAARYRAEQPKDLHATVTFRCTRLENDGTIEMKDVDYDCDAQIHCLSGLSPSVRRNCRNAAAAGFGYWVGTDNDHITEIQSYF